MSDAPIVQVTNDRVVYRASAIGNCLRALCAARLSYNPQPPPPALQKAYDEGHKYEPIALAKLQQEHGWRLEGNSEQHEVILNLGITGGRRIDIVGHVDALGRPPGAPNFMPIDVKSFSQTSVDDFLGNSLFPHGYDWQQSVYALALGRDNFCLPLYNKDTGELTVKIYDTLPHTYEEIADRIAKIELFCASTPELVSSVECPSSWGCPYSYLHDAKPVAPIPVPALDLIPAYQIAKRKVDAFTEAKKILSDKILSNLPYDDYLRIFTGQGLILSVVNNSRRMNVQKIRELLVEAGLDPDDYYTPGEGVQLRLKEKSQ
jgi:hypothetical protein